MNSAQLDTEITNTKDTLDNIVEEIGRVILGKEEAIRLSLACLLARGHLLIEDLPGVGKTILSHVIASTLGLEYQRIQFTSDPLPADIMRISIYDRDASSLRSLPEPFFSQLIFADEVHRSMSKVQRDQLEASEKSQDKVDGKTSA